MARIQLAGPFDLALTLRSGQFFRYRADGDRYAVADGDRVFRCRQDGDSLVIEGTDERHARILFGLDGDHAAALKLFRSDPRLAPLLADYGGMRVMRQDPWQCLVSFVCSAMSNVKRIQANVEGIAAAFGECCPVDVWIRRLVKKHYFGGRKAPDRAIAARMRNRFGPHTALAQQILFAAGRDGRI